LAKSWKIREFAKFAESSWKAIVYSILFCLECSFIFGSDFFPTTENCWKSWPEVEIPISIKYFYLLEMGFYLHTSYAHFTIEVRRSDHAALGSHHLVTLGLLFFSYKLKFHKIGILVSFCHDISDIVLEIGKTSVYRNTLLERNIWFAALLISWAGTRLFLFPVFIIYSTVFESVSKIPIDLFPGIWIYVGFNGGLIFLFCLHVYWFGLMLKVFAKVLFGGKEIMDLRESSIPEKQMEKKELHHETIPAT